MKIRWGKTPLVALLLLLIALATMVVGYGLWSQTLQINGTVETGTVDAEWVFVSCNDFEGKDVGTVTGWIDPQDPSWLFITLDNAYPLYAADCEVELQATGTIPIHVEAITFVPGQGLTDCSVNQSQHTGSFVASCDQLEVRWHNGLCSQLHANEPPIASSLHTTVLQPAAMNATYTYGVEVFLVQYNESACP